MQALAEIGVSYANGTAAHLDLCPWPTRPMTKLPLDRFASIVDQSLPWFWRSIKMAENCQLILMAGAVTNKHYMHEFLQKTRDSGGNALIGKATRGGTAFVRYHLLRVDAREAPLFFCSVSPSSRTPDMLPLRVREHREHLATFLV